MSDTKTDNDKTLSVSTSKLTLKRPAEQDTVRQSFSHGRSKTVVVEKKTQRKFVRPEAETPERPAPAPAPAAAPPAAAKAAPPTAAKATPPAEAPAPAAQAPAAAPAAAAPAPTPAPAAAPTPPAAGTTQAPRPQPQADARQARAPDTRQPRSGGQEQTRVPPRPDARNTPRPDGRGGRTDRPAGGGAPRAGGGAQRPGGGAQRPGGGQRPGSAQRSGGGVVLRTLTDEERDARGRALADARVREADERKRAEADAKRRAEEEVRLARERAEAERRKAEEDARRKAEDEAKRKAEEEAKRRLGEAADKRPEGPARQGTQARAPREGGRPPGARPAGVGPRPQGRAGDETGAVAATPATTTPAAPRGPSKRAPARPVAPPPAAKREKGAERNRGRLTMGNALLADEERARSVAAFRRRVQRLHRGQPTETRDKIAREVILPETITIQELANRMAERGVDVIRLLMAQGGMYKITDVIDADTAELVATELGHKVKRVSEADVEEGLFAIEADTDGLESRPPVVTIMGHVDHGKTSLLDAIRSSNVVSGEAGGITQHIGAYQVESPNGGKITFIDTPGHAAFTAMRARGAKVTDIVVLVVAADDGVMPQTVEAISHAKAANVPMIVAINKIDKPDANPQRVRTELLQYEVQVESMGGETQEIEVSALKRTNLEGLLDAISLQAELLELKANRTRDAEGFVIEAKLDKGRGPVATTLVQRGTLRVGDILVAGSEWGRVRAMLDDKGNTVSEAGPSVPVEVLGFNGTPEAGDRFAVVENEARAREIADYRERQRREKLQARGAARGSLEKMMDSLKAEGQKVFPLVIKGDVQGSVEAIIGALDKLGTNEVAARVLHSGVGGVTESDVTLASASGAAIIAFNVRANAQARTAAEREGIEIRYYNIIYNLVDDVKAAMSGLLSPMLRETMLGNAQILEVFNITKVGKVAGCRVTDGTVQRGMKVRLIRDNVVIHEGDLSQLKRFKDDAREVVAGQECGMAFANYQDMRPGDVIECYRVEEVQRTL